MSISDYRALGRKDPPLTAAAIVAIVGLATIGGFFFFQYGLGLAPCHLCLLQRKSFYVVVPLAALLWLGAGHGASRKVLLLGFIVIALVMLWNSGVAAYHAGIEWKLWTGPKDCTGPIDKFGTVKRHDEAVAEHQPGALRRGVLAFPRPVARRLGRAAVVGAWPASPPGAPSPRSRGQ